MLTGVKGLFGGTLVVRFFCGCVIKGRGRVGGAMGLRSSRKSKVFIKTQSLNIALRKFVMEEKNKKDKNNP